MFTFAIIEDDEPTNEKFKAYLLAIWPDCRVMQFFNFESAAAAIETTDFDLVVSDLILGSGTDKNGGIKIAKIVDSMKCPLLIVSGSPQPELHRDIFKALGAWDYLQKPVVESDFATQIKRAILFRIGQNGNTSENDADVTKDPDLLIDHKARQSVMWKKKPVSLTMTEVRIVEELVVNLNETVTFNELFELINTGTNLQTLRVHIGNIRAAFKDKDITFDRIKSKALAGYYWHCN